MKDVIPEWALDNVYIGMQCYQHCGGHGTCLDGLFCQCDTGYSGMDCEISDGNPTFLKEEFEGNTLVSPKGSYNIHTFIIIVIVFVLLLGVIESLGS